MFLPTQVVKALKATEQAEAEKLKVPVKDLNTEAAISAFPVSQTTPLPLPLHPRPLTSGRHEN